MIHEKYVRIVPGAQTAVLFIHGIVGTPNHFRDLIPLLDLVPENYSIYNVLLDGHGKTVDIFAKTSMKKWRTQVWKVFSELAKKHEHVILVAHSMGTLFAIQLANEYPKKIPFLFLLAVPMRPWLSLHSVRNILCLPFGKLKEDVPAEYALIHACGVETTRKLWKYLKWIPRFLELFYEINRTEKLLSKITVPCVAFQSGRDELVSRRSQTVLEKHGTMEIHYLPESSHFYYTEQDRIRVQDIFRNMFKEIEDGID